MTNYEKFRQRINLPEIPALSGVRFVAVFLVIFYHLNIQSVPGGHGMMLFFVLSGFLITWLILRENEKTGDVSIRGFFKRRMLRIFPAFYVYWLIAVGALLVFAKNVPWLHAAASALYLGNYYYAFHPESNNLFSHTWSLAIEEQFYLFFPFLFVAFKDNPNRLMKVLAALIFAVWIWRFVLVYAFGVADSYIYCAFDTRIDHLLVGCLLAVVLKLEKFQSFWKAMLQNSLMPLLTIGLLLASIYFGDNYSISYKDTIGFLVEPILMAIVIAQLILFTTAIGWSWLEWRAVKYLGTISYSLYLYQQLTLYLTTKTLSNSPFIIQAICAIIVTIIAASLSYFIIEKPFLRLKNHDFEKTPMFLTRLKAYF
ncbi:MAG: acyltransferase family protein [Pyrinomonadaceae bacterium]